MKSKKAQEEMVGFVLIMLIVAVIFLVFLAIFVRNGLINRDVDSLEISHFLDSMLEYTTECSLDDGFTFLNLGDLFRECADNDLSNCRDKDGNTFDHNADTFPDTNCEVLAHIIEKDLILNEKSFSIGPLTKDEYQYGGFEFLATYEIKGVLGPLFDKSIELSCAQAYRRGSDKPVYTPGGKIIISLTLCR
jgi:hypothetical protein